MSLLLRKLVELYKIRDFKNPRVENQKNVEGCTLWVVREN